MGLSVALGNALSGLRTTETGLDTVSRNVANAGTAGYVRRSVDAVESWPSGVRDGVVRRVLDSVVQRQMRRESAGGAFSATRAEYLARLDASFGVPGSETALDTRFNALAATFQSLTAEPGNRTIRSEAVRAAEALAGTFNTLSRDVQALRSDAEADIAGLTDEANAALGMIERIEHQLPAVTDSNARADLLDARDRSVDRLSQILDVRVVPRGGEGIALFTAGGAALFDGNAARLAFDGRGALGAGALYNSDPAQSAVGRLQLTGPQGGSIDLGADALRSGEIAGLMRLRDDDLVAAQDRLDAMAAGLARAVGEKPVAGAPVSGGFDLDLAGLAAGNSFSVAVSDAAGQRTLNFVRVDSAAALPVPPTTGPGGTVVGIDFSGGMASVAAQVQSALGGAFTATNPTGSTLRIVGDGAAGTSNVLDAEASVSVSSLQGGETALPLFVDAGNGVAASLFTGAVDGVPQQRGFAARITLNGAVRADPGLLVHYASGVAAGDPARPAALFERLDTAAMSFADIGPGGALGSFSGTLGDFVARAVDVQAGEARAAGAVDEGQQVVVNALKERFADISGVSVDEELARLVELQNAYAANARIISTVRDMFDALMRI